MKVRISQVIGSMDVKVAGMIIVIPIYQETTKVILKVTKLVGLEEAVTDKHTFFKN